MFLKKVYLFKDALDLYHLTVRKGAKIRNRTEGSTINFISAAVLILIFSEIIFVKTLYVICGLWKILVKVVENI